MSSIITPAARKRVHIALIHLFELRAEHGHLFTEILDQFTKAARLTAILEQKSQAQPVSRGWKDTLPVAPHRASNCRIPKAARG